MSRKALLIGINYVGTSSALRGCINDVLNIREFLINEFKMEEDEIIMLTEAAGSNDLKPTHANILKYIKWLVNDAKNGDKLFFHYSGHGTHIRDYSGDENDNQDECICPLDYSKAGLITDDVLRQVLVDVLPKGCNLFGLFDCCHSGTILDLKYNYLFNSNPSQNTYNTQIEKKSKDTKADVILLSGCLDNQTSADAWIDRKSQGAMTYSFLKTYYNLKEKNKTVNCQRLMKDLNVYIKRSRFTQIPKLSTGNMLNLNSKIVIM